MVLKILTIIFRHVLYVHTVKGTVVNGDFEVWALTLCSGLIVLQLLSGAPSGLAVVFSNIPITMNNSKQILNFAIAKWFVKLTNIATEFHQREVCHIYIRSINADNASISATDFGSESGFLLFLRLLIQPIVVFWFSYSHVVLL